MASKVNRRRFLTSAGTGIVAGAAAAATLSARAAESASAPPPLPDADSQSPPAATGAESQPACCCGAAKMIFTCSGSADVGKIADLAARKLTEDGDGKMSCLAGIGGRVSLILDATKAAQGILVIDGCLQHCARRTLRQAGFTKFEHLALHDMGMEKGKTPATDEAVAKVVAEGKKRLASCSVK
jgi:uncharacterized metal-binding protein